MYEALVARVRYHIQKANFMGLKEAESTLLLAETADAIEELENKLCDWCGVCPKERRRPSDCEIIYPDMQVPEVAIIPAEEGET